MNAEKYLDEMKKIQMNLLDYLDYEVNVEENYQNLIKIFEDIKIHDNKYYIKSLLYLILHISNNHYRESNFFIKIEKILQFFTFDMKKYFSNSENFHIFKSNKRLLLFLIETNIIAFDEFIVKEIINEYSTYNYPQYFQPEIQPFINEEWFKKHDKLIKELQNELPENFQEKRKIGVNDDAICMLIQKDLIEDFIIYINKNFISINSTINPSIYETNELLLLHNGIALIEYAAFFGSTQIFNYLRINGAVLKLNLWIFAVHGRSEEIIHFLEENLCLSISNYNSPFEILFDESIKCHHIDVSNYILENYLQDKNDLPNDRLVNIFRFYNFFYIKHNINYETLFYCACSYDYYYLLVAILSKGIDIDINKKMISENIQNHII